MTIYLGPVGNLVALPSIGRGIKADLQRPTAVHQIAGSRGGRVVDVTGPAKRTYGLEREHLTLDELATLEALYLGAYGPGPFVLLEPWRRNLLSANQSSGTDVLRDATGFVAATGSVSSSTVQFDQGMRSLAWAVTAANQTMGTGNLAALTTSADPAVDVPVLPSTVYSAGLRAKLSGSTGSARIDLLWYTAAGALISAATGGTVALSAVSFTTVTNVNITSPSTAALCRLRVANPAMGAAQTIYLDQWQLQQTAALDAWTIGTGVPRVSFTGDLGQTYPIVGSVNASVELTEV